MKESELTSGVELAGIRQTQLKLHTPSTPRSPALAEKTFEKVKSAAKMMKIILKRHGTH